MILTAFSKYLQLHNEKLIHNKTTTTKLLCEWISSVIHKNPSDNVEKIVHKEIMLADNNNGDFLIVAKSESGRVLINALNNFALSYENYMMSKWLADKKSNNFINPQNL